MLVATIGQWFETFQNFTKFAAGLKISSLKDWKFSESLILLLSIITPRDFKRPLDRKQLECDMVWLTVVVL